MYVNTSVLIFRYKTKVLRRWSGEDVMRLRLTATLDVPVLKIISDDFTFAVNACDFSISNDRSTIEKEISLQNVSKCISYVSASVKYPFTIKNIRKRTGNNDDPQKILPDDILVVLNDILFR